MKSSIILPNLNSPIKQGQEKDRKNALPILRISNHKISDHETGTAL